MRDATAIDPANPNENAAIVDWVDCVVGTIGSKVLWLPEADPGNSGWFFLRPYDNTPAWNDPCLNLNTVSAGSTHPLLQFTCNRVTKPADQLWAPTETGTTPPGPTTTLPPPGGAHPFIDGVVTPIENALEYACVNLPATGGASLGHADTTGCDDFVPELVPGGWLLRLDRSRDTCLGRQNFQVTVLPCIVGGKYSNTVWLDEPSTTGGADFRLRAIDSSSLSPTPTDLLFLPTRVMFEWCRVE